VQTTVVVCDECGRSITGGRSYYSVTVSFQSSAARQTCDCCSQGCLLRRLARVLPSVHTAMVEFVPGVVVGLGSREDAHAAESAAVPT